MQNEESFAINRDSTYSQKTNMLKLKPLILIAIFIAATSAVFAQNLTPVAYVKAFYVFDGAHSRTFDRSAIDARKKWFSARLYRLFQNELKREKAYLKMNPNDMPYYGDGLPFRPFYETCEIAGKFRDREMTVKPKSQDKATATVRVIFAFPSGCADSDAIEYTFELSKVSSVWLIENVIFSEGSNLIDELERKNY